MEVLLVVQLIVVVCMIGVILIQRSSTDGFTGGGGGGSGLMSGRGKASLLTRTTAILATAFIVNSLVLAYMSSHTSQSVSIVDKIVEEGSGQNSEIILDPTTPPSEERPVVPIAE